MCCAHGAVHAQPADTLAALDRDRIATAMRIARDVGDSVWTGWSSAPFAILLVAPEREFLIGHPAPGAGFQRVGREQSLGGELLVRNRVFPTGMLATFPITGSLPVVVIGRAEQTGKPPMAWVLTLLHEHFHQLQFSRAGYYSRLAALQLSRGDTTGMWALNYAFPYDSTPVNEKFNALTASLVRAIDTTTYTVRTEHIADIRRTYGALRAALSSDDARYLEFQLWQEGVPRYVEYRTAALAAHRYANRDMHAISAQTWDVARDSIFRAIVRGTSRAALSRHKREVAYPVGAALALVLDVAEPRWKERYFEDMFTLPICRAGC